MTVICPADGIETSKAVQACVDTPGPVYIRIGRGFEPPLLPERRLYLRNRQGHHHGARARI